jgi:CubicO group peptidase (beta-lactamase class C family)
MHTKLNHKLTLFEHHARKAMEEWRVPGMAAAIVANGKLIYAKGFGVKRLGGTNPVDEKTVFQIGSVSKSFTASLISILVDKGKITWHDRVKKHLPAFKLNDPLATNQFDILDLMSQRSGLPPHAGHLLPYLGYERNYIINTLRYIKPTSTFRSDYAYQNNFFLVAAELIEKHTAKSWEENLQTQILKPLGMINTTATLKGYSTAPNRAQGHYYSGPDPDSPITMLPMNWLYHNWLYTVAPAGGINSNVLDMAKWLQLHLNKGRFGEKQLIGEKNTVFMHTPKTAAGPGVWDEIRHYCLGWVHSDYCPYPIIWHNGGTSGMKSIIAMIPQAEIGIVVLCNLYDALLPEVLCRTFFNLWFGKPRRDWSQELLAKQKTCSESLQASPAPDTPHRPLHRYTGTYYSNLYGTIRVANSGNSLTITLSPKNIKIRLKHWSGDTFVLYWPGVLPAGAGVQFSHGRNRKIEAIKIVGMNDGLTGVFTRKKDT